MDKDIAEEHLRELFADTDRFLCGWVINRTKKGYATVLFLVADRHPNGDHFVRDISPAVASLCQFVEFDRSRGGVKVKVAHVNPTHWVGDHLGHLLGLHIPTNSG